VSNREQHTTHDHQHRSPHGWRNGPLADNASKRGLPKAPETATTGGEVPAPAPDSGAAAQFAAQQQADETEKQLVN